MNQSMLYGSPKSKFLAKDKFLHVVISFLLVTFFVHITSIVTAWTITFFIGLGKEVIWDHFLEKGEADMKDMIANAIGIILAIAFLYFL